MNQQTITPVSDWRAGIYARVAEVIEADRDLKAVPGFTEGPEFQAAYRRLADALRALPFWLRWLFT